MQIHRGGHRVGAICSSTDTKFSFWQALLHCLLPVSHGLPPPPSPPSSPSPWTIQLCGPSSTTLSVRLSSSSPSLLPSSSSSLSLVIFPPECCAFLWPPVPWIQSFSGTKRPPLEWHYEHAAPPQHSPSSLSPPSNLNRLTHRWPEGHSLYFVCVCACRGGMHVRVRVNKMLSSTATLARPANRFLMLQACVSSFKSRVKECVRARNMFLFGHETAKIAWRSNFFSP